MGPIEKTCTLISCNQFFVLIRLLLTTRLFGFWTKYTKNRSIFILVSLFLDSRFLKSPQAPVDTTTWRLRLARVVYADVVCDPPDLKAASAKKVYEKHLIMLSDMWPTLKFLSNTSPEGATSKRREKRPSKKNWAKVSIARDYSASDP